VSYEVWIRKALRFRECAEEDLRGGRYDSVAFFAQQAAEFLLKGVLITGSRQLTHVVSELLAYLVKALGSLVPEGVGRCAEALEAHYIQVRCPDARLSGCRGWEAEEAVKCMDAVWRYVREVAGGLA